MQVITEIFFKLEDMKVLNRSPDLLNYGKTGNGQLRLIIQTYFFYPIWAWWPFWSSIIFISTEYSI